MTSLFLSFENDSDALYYESLFRRAKFDVTSGPLHHLDDDATVVMVELLDDPVLIAQTMVTVRRSSSAVVVARMPKATPHAGIALDAGADDVVTVATLDDEIVARVRAALRRRNAVNQWHTFGLGDGDVIVNEGVYVRPDGERVELSVHEMKLLVTLANAQGAVVSRDELSDRVWGKAEQQSRFVDVTVRRTRVKIEPNPEDPELLLTARGRGYRLFGVQRAGA